MQELDIKKIKKVRACLHNSKKSSTFAAKLIYTMTDERYLRLLSEKFPNAQAVVTELVNLRAILSLPKGTEHFVSDLHGESMAFIHMIKNASGVTRTSDSN